MFVSKGSLKIGNPLHFAVPKFNKTYYASTINLFKLILKLAVKTQPKNYATNFETR